MEQTGLLNTRDCTFCQRSTEKKATDYSKGAVNSIGIFSVCVVLFFAGKAIANDIEAEVVHWWYKGGDAWALEVLVSTFESRGGTWIDAAETDFYSTRESVVSRMAKGYPPTAIQWNAGVEIVEFAQLGLINPVTDAQQLQRFQHYYSSVMEHVTVDSNVIAIPVNVHNENWMWISEHVFEEAQVAPPQSFTDLHRVAGTLRQSDVVPLAVGAEAWQQRILFVDVLLSLAGRDGYSRLFVTPDVGYLDSPDFTSVIEMFTALTAHSQSFGDGSWSDQVAAVHRGEAAMLFMGDWARGEFAALGGELGVDFNCHMAPGVQHLLPVIDVFMLGGSDRPSELEAQRLLVDVLLDKNAVSAFNQTKGSVPPFHDDSVRDLDDSKVDPCESRNLNLLNRPDRVLLPFASVGDGRHAGLIQNAIRALWASGMDGWPKAREYFSDAIRHENERRRQQGSSAGG